MSLLGIFPPGRVRRSGNRLGICRLGKKEHLLQGTIQRQHGSRKQCDCSGGAAAAHVRAEAIGKVLFGLYDIRHGVKANY